MQVLNPKCLKDEKIRYMTTPIPYKNKEEKNVTKY